MRTYLPISRLLHCLFAILLGLAGSACSPESNYRSILGVHYILDMEDAARITDSTLEQTSPHEIGNGILCLHHIVDAFKKPEQRQAAAFGLGRVHQKALAGWRGVKPDAKSGDKDEAAARDDVLLKVRIFIGNLHTSKENDPIVTALWNDALLRDPKIQPFGIRTPGGIFERKSSSAADAGEFFSAPEVKGAILDFLDNSPDAKRAFIVDARPFVEQHDGTHDSQEKVLNWGPWIINRNSNYLHLDTEMWSLEGYFVRSQGHIRLERVKVYEVRGRHPG